MWQKNTFARVYLACDFIHDIENVFITAIRFLPIFKIPYVAVTVWKTQ